MTNVEPESRDHMGELFLRRFRAGEFSPERRDEVEQHLGACGICRNKLRGLMEEQRDFKREIPFERFAGGVERAHRVLRPRPRRLWTASMAGVIAAAAIALFFVRVSPAPHNRSKGSGVEATLRVASANVTVQRIVPPGSQEELLPGDRVRLGYRTADARYLAAVSVDDKGAVTPLYPESGPALAVAPTRETVFLPDSLEFTGVGHERVLLFLAHVPFDIEVASQAVKAAHEKANGDLAALTSPTFATGSDIQTFSWLFRKP